MLRALVQDTLFLLLLRERFYTVLIKDTLPSFFSRLLRFDSEAVIYAFRYRPLRIRAREGIDDESLLIIVLLEQKI